VITVENVKQVMRPYPLKIGFLTGSVLVISLFHIESVKLRVFTGILIGACFSPGLISSDREYVDRHLISGLSLLLLIFPLLAGMRYAVKAVLFSLGISSYSELRRSDLRRNGKKD